MQGLKILILSLDIFLNTCYNKIKGYNMKKAILILLLLIALPVNATVHRWEKELNDMCSKYVSTQYSAADLYSCLITNTRDYYIWRYGWETPVEAKVMGIISMYQPEVVNLSIGEKQNLAQYYNKTLPYMYQDKMEKRKNLYKNFTQADIDRIWSAR